MSHEQQWDARYAEGERIWSGKPNVELVAEVAGLPVGRALDLGCGEGADAVWLAKQGWQVTAADVSTVALARAAEHAAEAGVSVTFEHHDLTQTFPEGLFDLVSAQFLHFWEDFDRDKILRRAAEAVAIDGVLLIEGHMDHGPFRATPAPGSGPAGGAHAGPGPDQGAHAGPGPADDARAEGAHAGPGHTGPAHAGGAHGDPGHQAHPRFPTPDEVLAELDLGDGWEVLKAAVHEREQIGPDGNPAVRTDSTVKLRRRPAAG